MVKTHQKKSLLACWLARLSLLIFFSCFSFLLRTKIKETYDVKSRRCKLHHAESHLLSTDEVEATVVDIPKDREITRSSSEDVSTCS